MLLKIEIFFVSGVVIMKMMVEVNGILFCIKKLSGKTV